MVWGQRQGRQRAAPLARAAISSWHSSSSSSSSRLGSPRADDRRATHHNVQQQRRRAIIANAVSPPPGRAMGGRGPSDSLDDACTFEVEPRAAQNKH